MATWLTTWGTLPYQSRRIEPATATRPTIPTTSCGTVRGLDPSKRYQLHLTVYQGAGTATVQQSIAVDEFDTGEVATMTGVERGSTRQWTCRRALMRRMAASSYASSAPMHLSGAFVNEIALEELTLPAGK